MKFGNLKKVFVCTLIFILHVEDTHGVPRTQNYTIRKTQDDAPLGRIRRSADNPEHILKCEEDNEKTLLPLGVDALHGKQSLTGHKKQMMKSPDGKKFRKIRRNADALTYSEMDNTPKQQSQREDDDEQIPAPHGFTKWEPNSEIYNEHIVLSPIGSPFPVK